MKRLSLTWVVSLCIVVVAVVFAFAIDWDSQLPPPTQNTNTSSDRDTTAEEVRAAASQMNELQKQIDEQRASTRRENEQLQQRIDQRFAQIEDIFTTVVSETPEDTLSILNDITHRLTALETPPPTATVQPPLDYTVQLDTVSSIVWIEPLVRSTSTPSVIEVAIASPPQPSPVYTLPPTTIIEARALTALVGRVPIDGRIETPWRFKLISTARNMTSRRFQVPDLEGVIWSGVAYGDYTLSCVSGTIDTVSYVFADGTVHHHRTPSNPDDISAGIGWISDTQGNPCVPGEFKTNAPGVIRNLATAGALEGLARGYAEAQTRRTTDNDGQTSVSVTGDANDYALANAASDAVSESSRWLNRRLSDSFDAVYVPPGTGLIIHLEQQVELNRDDAGRRLDHEYRTNLEDLEYASLGGYD